MKLLNFNIIKLTGYLITGILIGFYFEITLSLVFTIFSTLTISLATHYFIHKNKTYKSLLFGILTLFTFVSIGIVSTKIYDSRNTKSHYTNQNLNLEHYNDLIFKISKRLKPDDYNNKYFVEILSINNTKVSGKIILNLDKTHPQEKPDIGNVYFTNAVFSEVTKPKNPFQFDYNKYLRQRNIYHQIFLKSDTMIQIKSKTSSLTGYAASFRDKVNASLKKEGFKDDALSIINALLLGQRQDISEETYNNYINAGVIHILAVSGLHVGILFLILTQLLKPLHRITYGKHIIKPLIIIFILWSFAFVVGLSPSVTRAVTMFSIITCAQFLKRPTNIINTLIISAFFMLLVKPIYLFDVGFQMSYLAVLAIVTIQPLLYKLWKPKSKVIDYFWQIFTVTIAAQLGVFPISLFYFHQFPSLFFISNIVIIPFLGIILGLGILVIALALLNSVPDFIVEIFSFIIDSLNGFIAWIAKFESFLFRDIPFNLYYVLACYFMILCGLYLWKAKSYKSIIYMLVSLFIFSSTLIYSKYKNSTSEFVIFNKNRSTLIGHKSNRHVKLYSNLDTTLLENSIIKNYAIGHSISHKTLDSLKSVYVFKNTSILVVDSLGIYNTKQLKPHYILLSNSPRVNLNRLIDSIKPKQIIADASNYKSYLIRWKQTCIQKKIPFHSTYEKGAYILLK